jgi:DNA-binding transcriptional MerR regulator
MRVKELSERAGIPLSTIKYYIREGLLPAGARSAPNQASYDESHVNRLALIRALREVGGVAVDVVREVLAAVDDVDSGVDPVEIALMRRPGLRLATDEVQGEPEHERALEEAREFMRGLSWSTGDWGEGYIHMIADAVYRLRLHLWPDYPIENLEPYARAAWQVSEAEMQMAPTDGSPVPMPGDDLLAPTRMAVLGTILSEPLVLAMRSYANTMRAIRTQEGLPLPPAIDVHSRKV